MNVITTVTRRTQERPAFSRARHFAYIIFPVLLGWIYMLATDRGANVKDVAIGIGHMTGYTVAVLGLLHLIRRVEEYQEPTHYARGTEFTADGPHGHGDDRLAA